MRKTITTLLAVISLYSCGKSDTEQFEECPVPWVLVSANQYKQSPAVGSVEAMDVINDGSIEVSYGTRIMTINKAFDYKFYVKSATSSDYIILTEARKEKNTNNGKPFSFDYKIPSTLKPGIYNAYFSTTCEGNTLADAYVFVIKEKL